MTQSVKHLISAQVTTPKFVSSSPASGSQLFSAEPASDPPSPVFLPLPCLLTLFLSKINKSFLKKNFFKGQTQELGDSRTHFTELPITLPHIIPKSFSLPFSGLNPSSFQIWFGSSKKKHVSFSLKSCTGLSTWQFHS